MSQLGKVILGVVMARIKGKIDNVVSEEQHGFRKGTDAGNAMFVLRMLLERAIEMQKDVYTCIIDSEKAFVTVTLEDMIDILKP